MLRIILAKWLIGLGIVIPYKNDNRDISNNDSVLDSPIHEVSRKKTLENQKEIAYEEVKD